MVLLLVQCDISFPSAPFPLLGASLWLFSTTDRTLWPGKGVASTNDAQLPRLAAWCRWTEMGVRHVSLPRWRLQHNLERLSLPQMAEGVRNGSPTFRSVTDRPPCGF